MKPRRLLLIAAVAALAAAAPAPAMAAEPHPSIAAFGYASPYPTPLAAGELTKFWFVVTNTGDVPLAVSIERLGFTGTGAPPVITCPAGEVQPGANAVCTGEYTLTSADVLVGSVVLTAEALGSGPDAVGTASPELIVELPAASALNLGASASPAALSAVGQVIRFDFPLANAGLVAVTNPAITTLSFSGSGAHPAITCPSNSLAPLELIVCSGTYIVTQTDLEAGELSLEAEATGTAGGDPVTSPMARVVLDILGTQEALPATGVDPGWLVAIAAALLLAGAAVRPGRRSGSAS